MGYFPKDPGDNLSDRDIGAVIYNSRNYAGMTGDEKHLNFVAEYLVLCATEVERKRIRWWWVEGVRDYCSDSQEVADYEARLWNRYQELLASI